MNKEVLKKLSYGIYVISSLDGDKATGCIANSLIQVTYDTIAVSIHHDNFTNHCIENSKKFAISILGTNIDSRIIGTFGYHSSRDIDKFKDTPSTNIDGLEIINDAIGYLICELIDKLETETHSIFLGKIIDCEMFNENLIPMTYAYFYTERKGLSPKNAPTYIKPENKQN